MEICRTAAEMKQVIREKKKSGCTVGFVPTMGALHEGHLSLVRCSKKDCDYTVVSIFVNPTQFNNPEDLKKYPRNEQVDVDLLLKEKCDLVYIPEVKDIYPEKDERVFEFDGLDLVMEGEFRSGHFNGVAQVVSNLFDKVEPHKAFFGIKDFQQVSIVSKMVEKLKLPVEIIACPIVREKNGLAMSSRNERLSTEEREHAAVISKSLFEAVHNKKKRSVQETKEMVIRSINENPYLEVEYFEIVDMKTLMPINEWLSEGAQVGCVAVNVGEVRLIDNISF